MPFFSGNPRKLIHLLRLSWGLRDFFVSFTVGTEFLLTFNVLKNWKNYA
jgi:hypothetical protein